MSESSSAELLDRLERIVVRFLKVPKSSKGLWNLQTDLLKLQQDVQASIKEQKRSGRRDAEAHDRLIYLRQLRWRCRRLGDAMAWTFLGVDRKVMHSLSINDPVPIPDSDHGSRGTMAIAQGLAKRRWGFPLLHDITDLLRIGDITFIKPGRENCTVEVKSRFIGTGSDESGSFDSYNIAVLAFSSGSNPFPEGSVDADEFEDAASGDAAAEASQSPASSGSLSTARAARQSRRMQDALARQRAGNEEITMIGSNPLYSTEVQIRDSGHMSEVQRVVRRARRSGYGSAVVEDTFLYIAMFDPEGVSGTTPGEQITADLQGSSLPLDDGSGRDHFLIYGIPPEQHARKPQLYLPFYLYGLPRASIIDLLRGRLVIGVVFNAGRILKALEESGIQVCAGDNQLLWPKGPLYIEVEEVDAEGVRYRAKVGQLNDYVAQMIYEFQGAQFLVDVARSLARGAGFAIDRNRDGNGSS